MGLIVSIVGEQQLQIVILRVTVVVCPSGPALPVTDRRFERPALKGC